MEGTKVFKIAKPKKRASLHRRRSLVNYGKEPFFVVSSQRALTIPLNALLNYAPWERKSYNHDILGEPSIKCVEAFAENDSWDSITDAFNIYLSNAVRDDDFDEELIGRLWGKLASFLDRHLLPEEVIKEAMLVNLEDMVIITETVNTPDRKGYVGLLNNAVVEDGVKTIRGDIIGEVDAFIANVGRELDRLAFDATFKAVIGEDVKEPFPEPEKKFIIPVQSHIAPKKEDPLKQLDGVIDKLENMSEKRKKKSK